MDDNTRYLIDRMDAHHESLRREIEIVRGKIDFITGFKNKVMGAAMVISGMVSALVHYLTGK